LACKHSKSSKSVLGHRRQWNFRGGGTGGHPFFQNPFFSHLVDPKEQRSITEIAYAFHFDSMSHFSRAFRSRFGYSPRQARQGAGKLPKANLVTADNGDPAVLGNWVRDLK